MLCTIAFAKRSIGDFNVQIDLEVAYITRRQSTRLNVGKGCGEQLDNGSTLGIGPNIANKLCFVR